MCSNQHIAAMKYPYFITSIRLNSIYAKHNNYKNMEIYRMQMYVAPYYLSLRRRKFEMQLTFKPRTDEQVFLDKFSLTSFH